jgi:hypothetical protein
MAPSRSAVAAAALVMLCAASAAGSGAAARGKCGAPAASVPATHAIMRVLGAGRDVWGKGLLRRPGGPTAAAAGAFLPPLLLARGPRQRPLTRSGVYYLPISGPPAPGGTSAVDLHVADGSEIVARRVGGTSIRVLVGPTGTETYGSCLARLETPQLYGGWAPVLETAYTDAAGTHYAQESFSTNLDGAFAALIHLEVAARAPATVRLGSLTLRVRKGERSAVAISWSPREGARPLDPRSYERARSSFVRSWSARVDAGGGISVPERLVEGARRAMVSQDLMLGWRYSVGNPYEELSFPEAPDVAWVLAELGYADDAAAILDESLRRPAEPYANWKRGEKLYVYAIAFRLSRDRAPLDRATPTLEGYVDVLAKSLTKGPTPLLKRERFSSDIPDRVYGFHAQTVAWAGLRAIASVWRETGHPAPAARAAHVAARLEHGLRAAVGRSVRRLPDRTLFVPARLLDRERPYQSLVEARAGSYWNLVMPFGFATGFFAPGSAEARGALAYMLGHGSRLLGLVRAGAYALYGRTAPFPVSGTDEVYGVNVARFLADNDRADQLVLSLYGQLAAAFTPGTFVAGEGASVAPVEGGRYRAMYLPPNTAANASFLETLRTVLVHEVRDAGGEPRGLHLAFATPRAWLEPGKQVSVSKLPTSFGPLSYSLIAEANRIRVHVDVPTRAPMRELAIRLRLPNGRHMSSVTAGGRSIRFDRATGTIDLTGFVGSIDLVAAVS